MANEQSHTLEVLARHLLSAVRPLTDAADSPGAFMHLMARLGFFVGDIPAPYQNLATDVRDAIDALENLSDSPSLQELLGLLQKSEKIYGDIQALRNGPAPSGADPAAYAAEIGERLFELLLTDYLAAEQPGAYNLFSLLNVIATEAIPAAGTRPSYVRTRFRWEELPKIVSDPSGLPARVYGWGQADFKSDLLLQHVALLGLALRLHIIFRSSDETALSGYMGEPDAFPPPAGRSLILPFFYANVAEQTVEGALALQRLPAQGTTPPGLILEPLLPAEMPLEFPLGPEATLRIRAGTNLGELFGITLRPPGQVKILYPLAPGTPPPAAGIGIGFTYAPAAPLLLLGDPNASRLEIASASANLGADVVGDDVSLTLGADLQGLKLVIAAGDGDGFIRAILGDAPASIDLPLGIEWSKKNGIRFKGSAAFEVALHPHLQLGPLRIEDVSVKLSSVTEGSSKVTLDVGAGISGDLGAFKFLIKGIGLSTVLSLAPGNAGPFGIAVGFKPPNGIGLEIDVGGFVGGGSLFFEPDKGEYSGTLELTFQGRISIRAIGILSTKSGGSSGFSLLVLIVAEFPPLQLSFGFTLLGVGGLLGLNRAVMLEQLQLGVRDGSLDSILFPVDVVSNAARIIADLQRIFPAQDGLFLIGPMAKLGWGTPALVSLEIGLILNLPRPMFAIVGILRVAAPADEIAVLDLRVSFAGSVDFEKGQLQFDASLFDSRILAFPLTGDMAVRIYWKDHANLLLTVGGFHPAYTPPPMNLGTIARLGIVLFEGNPDVRAEAYLAITSNTVQFGARVEIKYGIPPFNVYGFVGLDVLINSNPFHFVADIAATLAVRNGSHVLFSIRLQMMLEGPTPWHAHGTGSFEIGFVFTVTFNVSFDVTVGDLIRTLLAPIDVLAEIVAALGNLGNWRPILPSASHQHVTLRALGDPSKTLVLHPFGTLAISQKVSPLNVAIQRFGSSTPDQGSFFQIVDVKVGIDKAPTTATAEEFAPAQFFTLSDAEKLSRPSFAQYDSGVVIGGDLSPRTDWMQARDVVYEVIYLPEQQPVRVKSRFSKELSQFALGGSAAAQSPVSRAKNGASALSEQVVYHAEKYAVVSTDDLTLHAVDLVFDNATAADQALRRMLAQKPELTSTLQVLPMSAMSTSEALL